MNSTRVLKETKNLALEVIDGITVNPD